VLAILGAARFAPSVERTAERVYRRLAAAEAVMHGTTVDDVVFHEVGQIDAIIDIAGAAVALELLGIERVYCSALPCGTGRIRSAHGEGPSPAPATMELLRGHPTYTIDLAAEFVTPTGAAILTEIASFEPRPPMVVREIGYGSGRSDFPFPNVLRVLVGETRTAGASEPGDDVVQIETNIDDMDPRVYEHAMERIFSAGAVDVWTQAIGMKKGRPGVLLCALVPADRETAVAQAMLAETTTIGVRSWRVHRTVLERENAVISTSFGDVRVKIVDAPGGRRARAEYEDCKRIAQSRGLPLADVLLQVEREITERLERN
jgi:pyridinium-3,5-bisthiocarboxylic acid mononucleotide nickel chelatase